MMKRSLDRGLGRGAAPKRSRSPRGPPVCISSIAQHARPKSMYQTLFARPQLRSAFSALSALVVMTLPPSSAYLVSHAFWGAIRFRFEAMSLGSLLDRLGAARQHRLHLVVRLGLAPRLRAARHVLHPGGVALDAPDPLE